MAIKRIYNGKYQARIQGPDGRYLTKVFPSCKAAEEQETKWKQQKQNGALATVSDQQITVNRFFAEWFSDQAKQVRDEEDTGWLDIRAQQFRDFIQPLIGPCKLRSVTPQMVKRVLNEMAQKGRAPQTRLHVFAMLRQMFNDAIEDYRYMTFNPTLRKYKPKVPIKETAHLGSLDQIKQLLRHVDGRMYGLGIWIQLYLGLRIGELQALQWEDIDFESGRLHLKRTYVRKKHRFRDCPKGKKHLLLNLPPELCDKLEKAKEVANSIFVVPSESGSVLPYEGYFRTLQRYCQEAGVSRLGTHGLRHSTSTLYRSYGASRDDVQLLFAHSSSSVTARYLHGEGTHLARVVSGMRLFGDESASAFSAGDCGPPTNKKRTKLELLRS